MKSIMMLLLAVAVGFGGYVYLNQPAQVPEIVLADGDGNRLGWADLRGDKEHLLLIFVLPNCPISKFGLEQVAQIYDQYSRSLSFAGLYHGGQDSADSFGQKQALPFPLYGIKNTPDPMAVNELFEAVGSSHGMRDVLYGGTILVLDSEHKLLLKLEKEDLRELTEKLESLFI